jgi:hypothetical protein
MCVCVCVCVCACRHSDVDMISAEEDGTGVLEGESRIAQMFSGLLPACLSGGGLLEYEVALREAFYAPGYRPFSDKTHRLKFRDRSYLGRGFHTWSGYYYSYTDHNPRTHHGDIHDVRPAPLLPSVSHLFSGCHRPIRRVRRSRGVNCH